MHTGEERLQAHEVEVELAHGLVHHGRELWLGKVPLARNRYAPRGCDLERAEVIQQVVIREALLHPAGALEKSSALNGGPEDATPSVPETRNLLGAISAPITLPAGLVVALQRLLTIFAPEAVNAESQGVFEERNLRT